MPMFRGRMVYSTRGRYLHGRYLHGHMSPRLRDLDVADVLSQDLDIVLPRFGSDGKRAEAFVPSSGLSRRSNNL